MASYALHRHAVPYSLPAHAPRPRSPARLAVLAAPSAAGAQSDVRVQGTTDTTDSGLIADVIQPGFEAAFPQYELQYIAVGTGQALTNARNGQADAEFLGFDGHLREPGGVRLFRPTHVTLADHGDIAARVTRRIPTEDGVRLEPEADAGRLVALAPLPGPDTGHDVRARVTGGVHFPD